MRKILIIAAFLFVNSSLIFAQIGIFPQAVFLNERTRSGNMKILNSSGAEKEVIIDMQFGYPGYDSLGLSKVFMGDTLPEAKYSAAPYVRVFPKRLILKAGEEQVVRFMLGNSSKLEDGTYFGRVVITSKNPPEEITEDTGDKIQAKLDLQFTLIAAIIFQKGENVCKLGVTGGEYYADSTGSYVIVDFERGGNAPFYGTAELKVFDSSGSLLAEKKEITPVYFNSRKAFKFDDVNFKEGEYLVEVKMTDEHKDVPKDFKAEFSTVKKDLRIRVDGGEQ